jgi:hypothetical protein
MADNDIHAAIFESLLEQTKAIRDVKVQVESLKQMMFEHRPAFVPVFEEQVKQVAASPNLRQLDTLIDRLENALRMLKAG